MSGGERACWLPSAVELPPSRERGIQPVRSPIAPSRLLATAAGPSAAASDSSAPPSSPRTCRPSAWSTTTSWAASASARWPGTGEGITRPRPRPDRFAQRAMASAPRHPAFPFVIGGPVVVCRCARQLFRTRRSRRRERKGDKQCACFADWPESFPCCSWRPSFSARAIPRWHGSRGRRRAPEVAIASSASRCCRA